MNNLRKALFGNNGSEEQGQTNTDHVDSERLIEQLLAKRYDIKSNGDTLLHKSIRQLTNCSPVEEHFIVTQLIPRLVLSSSASTAADKRKSGNKHTEWLNTKTGTYNFIDQVMKMHPKQIKNK
jgi:hypothetical protein